MKVEDLSSFKIAFDHMPVQAQILQLKVTLSDLRRKFGLRGTLSFLAKVLRKKRQLTKRYGVAVKSRFADVPPSAIRELYLLSSMYLVLAEMEGKESAYEFLKSIFHKIGPTAHGAIYNIRDLERCEGDIFTNFCKLNRAIFENSAGKGFYNIEEISDSDNLQYLRLTTCLNVDAFSTLDCPELARLGCEIDMACYAPEALGDKVNLDFRRPSTIAKGGSSCEFHYYRKGHAPQDMATL